MRRGLAQCSYLFVPHKSINLQNKTQTMRLLASLCSQENFDQWECSMDPSHSDLCLWQCGLHIGPYGKANLLATSADFRRCTKVQTCEIPSSSFLYVEMSCQDRASRNWKEDLKLLWFLKVASPHIPSCFPCPSGYGQTFWGTGVH